VLLLQTPAKFFAAALLGWAAAVAAGRLMIHSPGPSLVVMFNPLTIEFILGCFVALAIRRGINRLGPVFIALGAIGFVMAATKQVPSDSPWERLLGYGVPSALLLYGAAAAEARNVLRMPAALSFVGDISYSMYLSHGLVLAALGRVWWRLFPHNALSNVAACLVLASIAIVFAILSYRLIERPLQSLLRRNPLAPRRQSAPAQITAVILPADGI